MGTNQMSPQGQNRKFITGTNLSFRRSTLKKKEKKRQVCLIGTTRMSPQGLEYLTALTLWEHLVPTKI